MVLLLLRLKLLLSLLVRLEPGFPPSEYLRPMPVNFGSDLPSLLVVAENQLEIFSVSRPGRGKLGSMGGGPISTMFWDRLVSVHSLSVLIRRVGRD